MLRRFLRWLLAGIYISWTFFSPSVVFAAGYKFPAKIMSDFSQNDILFYDPCDGEGGEDDSSVCVAPTGSQVTWIGDSYSEGAELGKKISGKLSGVDVGNFNYNGTGNDQPADSYVKGSKFVESGNDSNPSGLTILKKIVDAGDLRPYLVFALGGNGGISAEQIDKVVELAGESTKIVFANLYMTTSDKNIQNYISSSNQALKAASEKYNNVSVADWASVAKDEYYSGDSSGVHPFGGYDEWVDVIVSALPNNCSAGLLPGDDNAEKIWNYFVKAGIDGISNNPAAISGILGNIMGEGAGDPLLYGGNYYGLFMVLIDYAPEFKKAVDDAGLGKYWHTDYAEMSSIPVEANDKALEIELDWLVNTNSRFKKGGEGYSFLNNIDTVSEKQPENYSDLFVVSVEGAYGEAMPSVAQPLIDGGAKALEDKYFPSVNHGNLKYTWQGAETRRKHAREFYDKYASSGSIPSAVSTDFSTTETLSSAANVKYDATNKQLGKLLKFSIWEAQQTEKDYADILSTILDDFEKNNPNNKGKTDDLIKYIDAIDDKFIYRDSYEKYVKGEEEKNIKPDSEQLEKAKSIVIDGLRTTSAGRAAVVGSANGSNNKYSSLCPKKSKKGAAGGDKIAETAALMAWPVQSWQTSASDFESNRVGKCYNDFDADGKNSWVPYSFDSTCTNTPRDLYKEAYANANRLDCGIFSLSVLRYLNLIDDPFLWGGQPGAGDNFRKHSDEWREIKIGSESDLKPGDVLWNNGHIMIYVGQKYGGEYGAVAHASVGCAGGCQLPGEGGRVGQVGGSINFTSYTAFRYTGDKLGSGEIGDGLTQEQAGKLAANYNTNKGDWSGYPNNIKVAAYGNYCHGSECASDYSNCTLFSGFFAEMFWGVKQQGWPDGIRVVDTLKGLGFETGNEPRPFAIFSTSTLHTSAGNHTGVVVGVNSDGTINILEAGWPNLNATYTGNIDISGHNIWFAYPKNVDMNALEEFINR